MDRAGLVGDDGPTHHGAFDIAYLRCLPNITLMAPRDEAMLVHMLHTALRHDAARSALRYPRGEAVGVPLPRRAAAASRSARARSCARASAWRSSATAPASARRSAPRTCSPRAGSTSRSPTRASPSRSTPGLLAQLAAEHDLLVTVEEGVLAGGFGTAVWEALSDGGLAPRDPARRAARPLRHPRRAGAAARRGRLHAGARSPSGIQAAVLEPRGVARRRRLTRASQPAHGRRCSPRATAPYAFRAVASASRLDPCWPSAACSRRARAPRPRSWRARSTSAPAGGGRRSPGSSSPRTSSSTSPRRRRTSRAAGSSWPTRSTRSASTSPGAARSTSAPRPAASPTACCSAAPRTWSRSTSPTASSRLALRDDPRVTVLERVNARALDPAHAARTARPRRRRRLVHLARRRCCRPCSPARAERFDALAMVKPQFEVGRERVGKGGVVRDPALRREALVARRARPRAAPAPRCSASRRPGCPGRPGNRETFVWLAEARPRRARSTTSRPRRAEVEP